MEELSREYLVDFYTKSLMLHGDRPEALRWSAQGQQRRFSAIVQNMPAMHDSSLLDYGCGKGDLLTFLNLQGINTSYSGIDITPALIELAQSKFPAHSFSVCGSSADDIKHSYDHIIACGVFNNNIQGTYQNMLKVIRNLYQHTNKAMAITALSDLSRDKSFELNYVNPQELLGYVHESITPLATLHEAGEDIILILQK
jgi:cyclopropane fatty-acyl-phospholipid synthase-like methyltransferase